MFSPGKNINIYDDSGSMAVAKALDDLIRDLDKICGITAVKAQSADKVVIRVAITSAVKGAEQYRIQIKSDGISIEASDELGAIYGIYRLSRETLGVEPMWFWKDSYPATRDGLELEECEFVSVSTTFKYRGWFMNDEDLLTGWLEGSGPRHIDYPHYAQVISLDIVEAVYESALRCGVNLIIPASFLDIMNPYEAELIIRAVARGLYVTQHHIEPLGVSHFGFENYWKARGENVEFSYGAEPERVIEAWRAFAGKWYEIAGDHVVWQTGLRGKGDRSIWHSDKSVNREAAGAFISKAFKEQMDIIRSVDQRSEPPVTTTLWAEMSDLMAGGEIELPAGMITIFCDKGCRQDMAEDFYTTVRTPELKTGIYYHIAFWIRGAHLLQGIHPAKVERVMRSAIDRGDTEYAIINVSDIREHTIGIEAAMGIMCDARSWNLQDFMKLYAGELATAYNQFFSAFACTGEGTFQDGDAVLFMQTLHFIRESEISGRINNEDWLCQALLRYGINSPAARRRFQRLLELKAEEFDLIADGVPPTAPQFHRFNLQYQARQLANIYRVCAAVLLAVDKCAEDELVIRAVDRFIALMPEAEYGKWENWYSGATKANWHELKQQLINLSNKVSE
jgi:hypothetical protein